MMQFIWWPTPQFWFVRDERPLGLIYAWRLRIGWVEIRRWQRYVRGYNRVQAHGAKPIRKVTPSR